MKRTESLRQTIEAYKKEKTARRMSTFLHLVSRNMEVEERVRSILELDPTRVKVQSTADEEYTKIAVPIGRSNGQAHFMGLSIVRFIRPHNPRIEVGEQRAQLWQASVPVSRADDIIANPHALHDKEGEGNVMGKRYHTLYPSETAELRHDMEAKKDSIRREILAGLEVRLAGCERSLVLVGQVLEPANHGH